MTSRGPDGNSDRTTALDRGHAQAPRPGRAPPAARRRPGEDTTTFQRGGCPYTPSASPTSQLADAGTFLKKHRGRIAAVTLSIGANNFTPCAAGGGVDLSCVGEGLDRLKRDLPGLLEAVRRAAGKGTRIALLMPYNPYLAFNLAESTTYQGQSVPVAVANVCTFTQMCLPAPQGNIHPSDAGYARLAKAFNKKL